MRQLVIASAAAALLGTGAWADDIQFEYTLQPEAAASSPMEGFEKGPATLQVRLKDSGYLYIVTSDQGGGYKVVYPPSTPAAAINPSDKLPPVKLVHLTTDPGVQRVFLFIGKDRMGELDQAMAGGGKVSETLPFSLRNKLYSEGVYTREVKGTTTKVKVSGTAPAIVEEIALLRGGASTGNAKK